MLTSQITDENKNDLKDKAMKHTHNSTLARFEIQPNHAEIQDESTRAVSRIVFNQSNGDDIRVPYDDGAPARSVL